MQQIQHRERPLARLIPRRGVDVHASWAPQSPRVVGDLRHRPVGYIQRILEPRPGNLHQTPDRVVRFTRRRVARVDDRDAVHLEAVAVRSRVYGGCGGLPNALGTLGQGEAMLTEVQVAVSDSDHLGLGREQAEGDAPAG